MVEFDYFLSIRQKISVSERVKGMFLIGMIRREYVFGGSDEGQG